LAALDKHNFWYTALPFLIFSPHAYTTLPNTVVIVTLISNFGTFLLYMTTCIIAIVAFREHHMFNGFKHVVVPVFGLIANAGCMAFYVLGPKFVAGMSPTEPNIALGVVGAWGVWGGIYFWMKSKSKGKEVFLTKNPAATPS